MQVNTLITLACSMDGGAEGEEGVRDNGRGLRRSLPCWACFPLQSNLPSFGLFPTAIKGSPTQSELCVLRECVGVFLRLLLPCVSKRVSSQTCPYVCVCVCIGAISRWPRGRPCLIPAAQLYLLCFISTHLFIHPDSSMCFRWPSYPARQPGLC